MKELMVAAGVLLGVTSTGIQGLSSQDIATAIEQGRAGKKLEKKCGAHGINGFDMIVEGPVGRIMRAARDAKRHDVEFKAADVTATLAAPVLTVAARRDPTLSAANEATPLIASQPVQAWVLPPGYDVSSNATMGFNYQTDFALRSKPSGAAPILIRPLGGITYSRENSAAWRGPAGPFPGSNMTASFDLAAFKALPQGNVDVVIFMTDAGEQRCKISDKDRQKIR